MEAAKRCQFSLNLLKEIVADHQQSNVVYSPFSISAALALVLVGARDTTETELKQALAVQDYTELSEMWKNLSPKSDGVTLTIANKAFIDKAFKVLDDYRNALATHFNVSAETVDFKSDHETARKSINSWVESVTKNLIKNLLSEGVLNSLTVMVLVNAVYFKGFWKKQFKKEMTVQGDFYKTPAQAVKVSMMNRKGSFSAIVEGVTKQSVLAIPYKDDDSFMMIILPPKSNPDIDQYIQGLSIEALHATVNAISDANEKTVVVKLPKFKIELGVPLARVLKKMGIRDMFSDGANLSGISNEKGISVSEVIHKAFIEVDEEGTEAAAATAVVMMRCSAAISPPPLKFYVDRPFLYAVVKAKTILFAGVVRSP